jgi:hypothetical protein
MKFNVKMSPNVDFHGMQLGAETTHLHAEKLDIVDNEYNPFVDMPQQPFFDV